MIAYSNASFGQGTIPVKSGEFACLGNEPYLESCNHSESISCCGHQYDAGVDCGKGINISLTILQSFMVKIMPPLSGPPTISLLTSSTTLLSCKLQYILAHPPVYQQLCCTALMCHFPISHDFAVCIIKLHHHSAILKNILHEPVNTATDNSSTSFYSTFNSFL